MVGCKAQMASFITSATHLLFTRPAGILSYQFMLITLFRLSLTRRTHYSPASAMLFTISIIHPRSKRLRILYNRTMSAALGLYRLQQVDRQIDQIQARLRAIQQTLENDAELRGANQRFAAADGK